LVAQHSRKEPLVEPNWSPGAGFTPPESVAETLRRTRKERGENLRRIAENLRVRLTYLQALEEGDHDRLPGTAYALGFLRSYAEHLGLDSFQIVERYKTERQGSKTHADLVFPEPVADGRVPGGAIILISALLLALVYGGWTYFSSRETNVSDLVPELPDRLQGLIASEPTPQPGSLPQDDVMTYTPPAAAAQMADSAPAGATDSVKPAETPPGAAAEAPADLALSPMVPQSSGLATPTRETASEVSEPAVAAGATPEVAPEMAAGAPVPATDRASGALTPVTSSAPADAASAISERPAPEPTTESLEEPRAEPMPELTPVPTPGLAAEDSVVEETVVIPAPPNSAPEVASLPAEAAPQAYGETGEPSRIVLRATQDSWVQVRDAQDDLLLTRVLRAGDSYQVPDRPGLTLLTGNAGGIEIEVDGVTLPALGPVGAVRRQVELDPKRLVETLALPE